MKCFHSLLNNLLSLYFIQISINKPFGKTIFKKMVIHLAKCVKSHWLFIINIALMVKFPL